MNALSQVMSVRFNIDHSHEMQEEELLSGMQTGSTAEISNLAASLAKARSISPEKFCQDHVIAIFVGIYFETAMGPLLGAFGIYLYSHWMM